MKRLTTQVNNFIKVELDRLDEIWNSDFDNDYDFSYEICNYSDFDVEELRNKLYSALKQKFKDVEFKVDGKRFIYTENISIELFTTDSTNQYGSQFIEVTISEIH